MAPQKDAYWTSSKQNLIVIVHKPSSCMDSASVLKLEFRRKTPPLVVNWCSRHAALPGCGNFSPLGPNSGWWRTFSNVLLQRRPALLLLSAMAALRWNQQTPAVAASTTVQLTTNCVVLIRQELSKDVCAIYVVLFLSKLFCGPPPSNLDLIYVSDEPIKQTTQAIYYKPFLNTPSVNIFSVT